jgi:hypothetical protein
MIECTIFIAEVQLKMAVRWEDMSLYAVLYCVLERLEKSDWQLISFSGRTRASRFVAFGGKTVHAEMGGVCVLDN